MRNKVEIFKVMSESNRIRILLMLLKKPLCVCEITSILQLTTATVSSHLSYLRKGGFIEDEKEGKWINYKISSNIKDPIISHLLNLLPEWFSDSQEIMDDLVQVMNVDRYKLTCNGKQNSL